MKKLILALLYLTLILSVVSCSPESKDDSDGNSGSSSQDFDDGDDGDGGTTPPTTGTNNCTGTTDDGTGNGTPIHHFNLFLAGHQPWVPGEYDFNDQLISQTMINHQEAAILFASDSKLQVRFKIKSQPFPTAGEDYCYGRATGQPADQFKYTKLRFRVHLRDILCDTPDVNNPSQCASGFYLGPRYKTQYIDPVNVDSCSSKIDVGALRNSSPYGTTVEVEDVKGDSSCQAGNEAYCPAEQIVRRASCWRMTMQVVTDYTQSFK